jgi:DNA-directed RNA polymerase subunit alpha
VLNLKKVRLKSFVDQPVSIELDVRGMREVTAADLHAPSSVEVVNPDQYLATMDSPDAELHAEMIVERGKRYLPSDQNESLDIGTIPIDAVFSPIRRVNYVIERKRVGPMTNFERLVLEIWTDGTMAPSDAMTQSAEILRQHFQQVADFGKVDVGIAAKAPSGSSLPAHIYDMLIEKLELTPRAYNSLKRANISKVGEVLEMSEEELLAVRNFGKKSLDELKERLAANNLLVEASNSPLLQSSGSSDVLGDVDNEEEDE